jgi:hypothetical protein
MALNGEYYLTKRIPPILVINEKGSLG